MMILSRDKPLSCFANGINVDGETIVTSTSIKTLGVTIDAKLSLNKQISSVVSSCNFQLRERERDKDFNSQYEIPSI